MTGDMKVYAYYAKNAGWWTISLYLLACCAFVVGVTFPCKSYKPYYYSTTLLIFLALWLQWWTNANEARPNERIGYWLGVYGGLAFLAIFSATLSDGCVSYQLINMTWMRFD